MPNARFNDQVANQKDAPKSKPLNQAGKLGGPPAFKPTLSDLEKKEISFPSVAEEGKFENINS